MGALLNGKSPVSDHDGPALLRGSASSILVGSLNPAILTPNWLAQNRILTGEVSSTSILPADFPVLQFSIGGLSWAANPLRLEVKSEDGSADPGELIAKVLNLLPHTPVQAVGNNLQFAAPPGSPSNLQSIANAPLFGQIHSMEYEELGHRLSCQVKSKSGAILMITLAAQREGGTLLSFNFHRECASAAQAIQAARSFPSDKHEAEELAAALMKPKEKS